MSMDHSRLIFGFEVLASAVDLVGEDWVRLGAIMREIEFSRQEMVEIISFHHRWEG